MLKSLIATQLLEFFAERRTLEDLEDWTVARLQSAENASDTEVLALLDALDAALMEYRDGVIEKEELWAQLGDVLQESFEYADTVYSSVDFVHEATFEIEQDSSGGSAELSECFSGLRFDPQLSAS